MKIINPELLRTFANLVWKCEHCGGPFTHPPEVHHCYTRGAGRLDIRENLCVLGGPWDCGCHTRAQEYRISRQALLEVIARREHCEPGDITDYVFLLRRLPQWMESFRPTLQEAKAMQWDDRVILRRSA